MGTWSTRRVGGEPRDVFLSEAGKPVVLGAWRVMPDLDQASVQKDRWTTAIRQLGCLSLAEGSEKASGMGAHVLALALASAAYHHEDDPVVARALRLQELEAVGEGERAAEEGLTWLADPETPAFVGGLVAEVLGRLGRLDEAISAIGVGLERDPSDRQLHLDRARLFGDPRALPDLKACMEVEDDIAEQALELIGHLAEAAMEDSRIEDAVTLINGGAPLSHKRAPLTRLLAACEKRRGNLSAARRWLVHTQRLQPGLKELDAEINALDEALGVASTRRR